MSSISFCFCSSSTFRHWSSGIMSSQSRIGFSSRSGLLSSMVKLATYQKENTQFMLGQGSGENMLLNIKSFNRLLSTLNCDRSSSVALDPWSLSLVSASRKISSMSISCGSDSSPSGSLNRSSAPNFKIAVNSSLLKGFELEMANPQTYIMCYMFNTCLKKHSDKRNVIFFYLIYKVLTLNFLSCYPVRFAQWCPFSESQDGLVPSSFWLFQ